MTGRKNPETTEQERDHEYVMTQKRGYGVKVQGDLAEELDEKGAAGRIAREREEYMEHKARISRQDF